MVKRETTTIKDTLIAENQLIAERLKALDEKKVDKAFVDGSTVRYKLLSDNNFDDAYKKQLDDLDTTITTDITNAINELDYTDTINARQYVSGVSETDGVISVTRAEHLGGVLNVEDDTEIATLVGDAYYSKFLFSDKYGKLHYDSAIAGKLGRQYVLADGATITANKQSIITNLPHSKTLILSESDDDSTNITIFYDGSTDTLFIDKNKDGTAITRYSTITNEWSNGAPILLITEKVVDAVNKNGFIIDRILRGVNFLDRVILTSADKITVIDDSENLVISRTLKEEFDNLKLVLKYMGARVHALEVAHNTDGILQSFTAIDEYGNPVNAVGVDENGNLVLVNVIGG